MFDALVPRYDLLNDLLSLGMDRRWRRATARAVPTGSWSRVLDLGTGTGRLAARLEGAVIVGIDLSLPMLREARRVARCPVVQGSAFALPFGDGSVHAVVSAFVLRNLRDLPGAFAEMARVTTSGGRVALVDITEPSAPWMRRLFDAYLRLVAPVLGRLVGRAEDYAYLARSVAQLPAAGEVCRLLEGAGFVGCTARPLTWGAVTLFTADRGSGPSGGGGGERTT